MTKIERGAVLLHQLEQARVHRRPDASGGPARRRPGRDVGSSIDLAELGHVLDRDHDLDLERLAHAGVDDGDRPGPAPGRRVVLEAAEEAGDLLERPLGGRQADALRRALAARRRAARG